MKLSDELVLDARLTAEIAERSIAGQIEFWARIGRALEGLINGDTALALKKRGDLRPLSTLISTIDSEEGRSRLKEVLDAHPYPRYEVIPDQPNLLLRTEKNGKRSIGKFVRREFQVIEYLNPESGKRKKQ
ncbi:MAG: ParD-like family protein [Candidatus Obscuribacterales bacterium]|nr:ParD-like family protein [Candidatus Obscuribacterales bacterium]